MNTQKRIAAIHDISGIGKCSLTVALPIISAAGMEAAVIPTAVLSTHTGGISGYTYRDLSDDIVPFAEHWKSLNLKFDAIYTGFLGSTEQVDKVIEIIDMLKSDDTLVIVDPVMGDHGKLYSTFESSFPNEMKRLCQKADILTPNITEGCLLCGIDYRSLSHTKEAANMLHFDLNKICSGDIVITGVEKENSVGAVYYEKSGASHEAYRPQVEGIYHGTGDVFTSVLTAAVVSGQQKKNAIDIAVEFTEKAIERTRKAGTDTRFGVQFERELPYLINRLGL